MTTVTYEVEGQWTTGARWRSYDAESRTEAEAIMAVAFKYKTFTGRPMATKRYTVDELERMGYVGVYTYDPEASVLKAALADALNEEAR